MFSLRGYLFSLCLCFTLGPLLNGQSQSHIVSLKKQTIASITEDKFGFDDLLINGVKYRAENIRANGNPFFEWERTLGEELFIKGQSYKNVNLFYDINLDQLILKKVQKNYFELEIVLNTSFIDSFYLANHLFVNLQCFSKKNENTGYYEKIYAGRNMLLKKYKKRFVDSFDNRNPFGKFSPMHFTLFIFTEDILVKVNSKKELLKFYSENKKQIRRFIRKNRTRYKKLSNPELIKLMNFCDEISTKTN